MAILTRTRDKYEAALQDAQLKIARAARYSKEEDRIAAERDFAFAKLMVTLVDLAEDYPPLTDEQKREVIEMLEAS